MMRFSNINRLLHKIGTSFLALLILTSFKITLSISTSNDMVLIKGGTFMMGQIDGEGDERPVHTVTLDDFYISKYEVSVKQYKRFCQETSRKMPSPPEWGWIDNHPIFNTTWYDAMDYIEWYNTISGEHYRLPTEAEFEYVLRNGGQPGVYPWDSDNDIEENIADESLAKSGKGRGIWKGYDDGYATSSPIGSYKPNELGIYDINGNMWEWVSDWYSDYDTQPIINPKGPATGTHKVGRGASYNADPWHSRTAGRSWVKPDFAKPTFRLAMDVGDN